MRRLRPSPFMLLLPILLLPLIQAVSPGETNVERVGKAVTGAVESLSQKILNTTTNNATDGNPSSPLSNVVTDIPASQGRAALDDARRAASIESADTYPTHCGPICVELSNLLLTAVEGPACRTLFTTGKCPGNCMTDIAGITGNSSWLGCKDCDGDIASGAGERWAKLCGSRQETLIDAGKEAVKTLVGDGLSAGLRRKALLQTLVALLILMLGVGYGYRRGRVMAFRLGKRRLGRKNSDANLPV